MVASRRPALTEQDRALWAQYAAQLRPLRGRPAIIPPEPEPVRQPAPQSAPPPPPLKRSASRGAVAVGIAPAGLDRATWNRFQAGRLATDRRLDLHGLAAQHAYHRFEQVLIAAAAQGLRCVEVITGRGAGEQGGVLRRELPLWINLPHLRPLILAASYPHAANTGSVRLLLRRAPKISPGYLDRPNLREPRRR